MNLNLESVTAALRREPYRCASLIDAEWNWTLTIIGA
jgi:hypothetical protein